jgi:hypothetical protein
VSGIVLGFAQPHIPCSLLAAADGNSPGRAEGRLAVKMIAGYLQHALQIERLAAEEPNLDFKAELENLTVAYGKLAAERSSKLGLKPPLRGAG